MILRRLLLGWVTAAGLAGAIAGAAAAALRTGAGRRALVQAALAQVNRAVAGRVSVGAVGGSLTGGLAVQDLALRDSAGAPVVRIARAELRYRLPELLSRHLVLGQLRVAGLEARLVRDSTGRFNLERVLRLDRPGGPGQSRWLLAFRDVRLEGGTVVLETPGPGPGAPPVVRTITGLAARLPYVRLSSPLPAEPGVRVEIADLKARLSEPAVALAGLRGAMELAGDSLALDWREVRLPRSRAEVRGLLWWRGEALRYHLDVRAPQLATADLRWLLPELPGGLAGRAQARVRSLDGDRIELELVGLDLVGRGGGGSLSGRLGLVLGPGAHRTVTGADLDCRDFDLAYLRGLLDTLPLAGRLSGRFQGSGPEERLQVALDWTFRDSLVPGWPTSELAASGIVSLGGPGGLAFEHFAVRQARLDLGSVRRLVPVNLAGELDAAGTLEGPWRQAQFSGTLRHRDGARPASRVRGLIRVDSRGDRLGVWADVSLDSLELEGLRASSAALPPRGSFAGDLRLTGYLDSLLLKAELVGPPGRISAQGALVLEGTRRGAHWLDVELGDLDLHRLHPAWPRTRLSGRLVGAALADSGLAPRAQGQVILGASEVAGTPLDTLLARFRLADSVFALDTLTVRGPGWAAAGTGRLATTGRDRDSLRLLWHSDSVGVLAPLASTLLARARGGGTADGAVNAGGILEVRATLSGSWARPAIALEAEAPRLVWGPVGLREARIEAAWRPDQPQPVTLEAGCDSLWWGRFQAAALELSLRGRRDSLAWAGRGRWGEVPWLAGGQLAGEPAGWRLRLDSLGLRLPSEAWFVAPGSRLLVSDSVVDVDSLSIESASGAGRLVVAGRLPRSGSGDLRLSLERLPLPDLWALWQGDPAEVAGTLSGTLSLAGTARQPVVAVKVALQEAAFRGFRAPYLDGTLGYRDRRLEGQFQLWRGGQAVLAVALLLPVDLALQDPPAERRLPGPLAIRVAADSVDLALVEAMVPVARQTAGRLWADVGIAGSWDRPQLSGSLRVVGGAATFPALGVRHSGLVARLSLSGDTIRVDTLSVTSGEGWAVARGVVRLEALTRPILALHLRGENFRVMDVRDYLSFTVSGVVDLEGPVYGARLRGQGTLPRGVLYFTDLLTKQVVSLEDVRYADIIDTSLVRRQGLTEPFESRFLDSLRIDSLVLTMGSDVWMRSSEANIQLAGQLTVHKQGQRYRLDGILETPRGTYRLPLTAAVRSEFTVTRGQLQYFGTPDLNAAMDIEARHVVRRPDQNLTVMVHLGGTLYTPKVTLTSDARPPLPESELIANLLFGSSSVQALGQGGRRWAAATVFGQIERSLISDFGIPLDFVQIRPGETSGPGGFLSGTEIALGKQVTLFGLPVFWTLSPRLCPQQTASLGGSLANLGASAEVRLGGQWSLAASRDAVGPCAGVTTPAGLIQRYQFGFDLFWERAY